MTGHNLFVHKNKMVAFSDYFVKENATLMKLSLETMIVFRDKKLFIPLDSEAITHLEIKTNGRGDDEIRTYGAYSIGLNDCGDIEQVNNYDKLEIVSYRAAKDSYFARSNKWGIESAATVGCIIYDDVGTIYEEAYRSSGMTPPPFYVGNVNHISTSLTMMPYVMRAQIAKHINDLNKTNGSSKPVLPTNFESLKGYYKDPKHIKEDFDYLERHPEIEEKIRETTVKMMALERRNDILPAVVPEQKPVAKRKTKK